ncbi:MAG: hypothetical protein ACR2IP_12720 [Solirubrobacteraceae bacterium]
MCVAHGGRAPQVRAKAAERLQVQEAWKAVARVQRDRERMRRELGPAVSPWATVADEMERGIAPK